MAHSKPKKVKQNVTPADKHVVQRENPNSSNHLHPAWRFNQRDTEKWVLTKDILFDEVLPFLSKLETMTWNDIFIKSKKQNHLQGNLNKCAMDRIDELKIEYSAISSLRISGTHRIYGYRQDGVYNIIWYDDDHGDNATCVSRSRKKHT